VVLIPTGSADKRSNCVRDDNGVVPSSERPDQEDFDGYHLQ